LPCFPTEPWEKRYDVGSVVGGLTLRQPIGRRFAVNIGGNVSTGRANTEGFFRDLLPEYDHLEAPKRYAVRTTQLHLGLSVF
jgi:hypothetical protein